MTNDVLDQQVIHNNLEIFSKIENELRDAKSEILVAAAWFTDNDLFSLLLSKAQNGIQVEIIVAENKENEKLDFQQLVKKGASVLKVRNVGYGMMHQKFCVIDRKIALHGSYNWSVNAKKNNHESIIATNHKGTVDSLVANFFDIKQKAIALKSEPEKLSIKSLFTSLFNKKNGKSTSDNDALNGSIVNTESNYQNNSPQVTDTRTEYEKVLDSMISAEVSNFDRGMLRQQGYDRAKANNGDAQVLTKALDSVYSVFINEINVVEDKKNRLITKIEEQKTKSTVAQNEGLELHLHTIESECDINKENLATKIANLKSQVSINDKEVEGIKHIKIPAVEDLIHVLQDKVKAAEREFVKPALKLFELIPVAIINLGLLLYLILFYSSAAYILLFSELDAKLQEMSGTTPEPAEVFNPEAISNALEKGWAATFFIFLFVFLPLAFALAGRFTQRWKSIVGMVLIDIAIAYKVAQSVHTVNYMGGTVDEKWNPIMVFQDVNFYLVFILGAGGLIFFSYAFDKFMSYFEERNPDMNAVKNQVYMHQLKDEIQNHHIAITGLKEQIENFEKNSIQCRTEILICEAELDMIPNKRLGLIEKRKSEHAIKVQNIDITTDIYKSHIENDNLPISVDSMKDRINVFLEGWNDFLHDEYAVIKAVEKSGQAAHIITNWQEQKLNNNALDRRIKP